MQLAMEALANHVSRLKKEHEHLVWIREHGYGNYPDREREILREVNDCEEGLNVLRITQRNPICD